MNYKHLLLKKIIKKCLINLMLLVIKTFSYSCSNFFTINAIKPNDKKNMNIRNVVMIFLY